MSNIRIGNDMQSRGHYVADRIDRLLSQIADEASADGWDGRELLTGVGVSLGRACQRIGLTPRQAIDLVQRLDLGMDRETAPSLLVAPSGRPLQAPARKVG
jgi:hypothetical protein